MPLPEFERDFIARHPAWFNLAWRTLENAATVLDGCTWNPSIVHNAPYEFSMYGALRFLALGEEPNFAICKQALADVIDTFDYARWEQEPLRTKAECVDALRRAADRIREGTYNGD